jgi:hypothetical protein
LSINLGEILAMKTITKALLAGTAAFAAGGVANAQITNLGSAPGGSDLVLFVTDTLNSATFVQDLGVNVDSLGVTTASVQADAAANREYSCCTVATPAVGPLNNPVGTNGIDSALATFLNNNAGGTFVYGVLGVVLGTNVTGTSRTVFTMTGSPSDAVMGNLNAGALFTGEPSTSQASANAQVTNAFFVNINGNSTGYDLSTGAPYTGKQAASTLGVPNSAGLGTSMYFYEMSTYADANTTDANIYGSTVAFTVGTNGSISGFSSAAPVPIPAAVWLLGSGVIGLLGIGRRRLAA